MARVVSIVNRTGANAVKFDTMRNDFMKDAGATRVDVEGPVFVAIAMRGGFVRMLKGGCA